MESSKICWSSKNGFVVSEGRPPACLSLLSFHDHACAIGWSTNADIRPNTGLFVVSLCNALAIRIDRIGANKVDGAPADPPPVMRAP